MKFVLATALLFVGLSANASLKLQLQGNGYDGGDHVRPQVGIAYYQPLLKKVALNSYIGTGIEPFQTKEAVRWSTAKASLDFFIKDVTLGLGGQFKDIEGADNSRSYGFVKLEYKLF